MREADITKKNRHQAILEIVGRCRVQTQGELSRLLREKGYRITQATVSRDIKELGLVKLVAPDGGQRYVLPPGDPDNRARTRLERVLQETVTSVESTGNLLVIKSLPGSAQMVASVLDTAEWPEIMGTIAGDDTLLVITRDAQTMDRLRARLAEKMGGE